MPVTQCWPACRTQNPRSEEAQNRNAAAEALDCYFVATASRRKLITLPSAAKPAPSASATVAPSWPASAKHSAASAAPVVWPGQARGGDDAGGAAAAVGGALDIIAFMFGAWKKPNPMPQITIRQTMSGMRVGRQHREQCHAEAEQHEPDAAEQADRMPVGEAPRDRRHDADHQRPRRHEEAGLDLRAAEHVLEIERQRDEGEALHGERAHRGRRRQREHRPAEQVDRQHRRGMVGMPARQDEAECEGRDQLDGHEPGDRLCAALPMPVMNRPRQADARTAPRKSKP